MRLRYPEVSGTDTTGSVKKYKSHMHSLVLILPTPFCVSRSCGKYNSAFTHHVPLNLEHQSLLWPNVNSSLLLVYNQKLLHFSASFGGKKHTHAISTVNLKASLHATLRPFLFYTGLPTQRIFVQQTNWEHNLSESGGNSGFGLSPMPSGGRDLPPSQEN